MECYTLSHCNKQIFQKYESYKCFIIYQGMFCVSFKLGNTVNPEKLQVEVIKQLFFRFNFGSYRVDKLLIYPHMRVDK